MDTAHVSDAPAEIGRSWCFSCIESVKNGSPVVLNGRSRDRDGNVIPALPRQTYTPLPTTRKRERRAPRSALITLGVFLTVPSLLFGGLTLQEWIDPVTQTSADRAPRFVLGSLCVFGFACCLVFWGVKRDRKRKRQREMEQKRKRERSTSKHVSPSSDALPAGGNEPSNDNSAATLARREQSPSTQVETPSKFVRFACDCGKKLRTTKANVGKRSKCPECGAKVIVPGVRQASSSPGARGDHAPKTDFDDEQNLSPIAAKSDDLAELLKVAKSDTDRKIRLGAALRLVAGPFDYARISEPDRLLGVSDFCGAEALKDIVSGHAHLIEQQHLDTLVGTLQNGSDIDELNDLYARERAAGALHVLANLVGAERLRCAVEPLVSALVYKYDEYSTDSTAGALNCAAAAALARIEGAESFDKLADRLCMELEPDHRIPAPSLVQGLVCLLEKMGGERIIAPVSKVLLSTDDTYGYDEARRDAARVLGDLGDTAAIEPLKAAIEMDEGYAYDHFNNRYSAARALGKIGGQAAFDILTEMVHDEGSSGASGAAQALGEIGDPRAIDSLEDQLTQYRSYIPEEKVGAALNIAAALVQLGVNWPTKWLLENRGYYRDSMSNWAKTVEDLLQDHGATFSDEALEDLAALDGLVEEKRYEYADNWDVDVSRKEISSSRLSELADRERCRRTAPD